MIPDEIKKAIELLRSGSLHDMDTDIEATNDAAALVLTALESNYKEIERLRPYEAAVRAAHNGYDAEMRAVMPELKEPATPADALREIREEMELVHEGAEKLLSEKIAELQTQRDAGVDMLAEWCCAIDRNGTGWDDWDEHYKDACYRDGPIRSLIDARMEEIKKEPR